MSLNGPGSRPSLCDILTASLVPKIQPLRISHSQLGVCEPECLSWEGCLGGLLGSSWLPHVQIPAINSTSQVLALNTQISVSTVEWQWLLFNFQLKKKKDQKLPETCHPSLQFFTKLSQGRHTCITLFSSPSPSMGSSFIFLYILPSLNV